MTVDLLFTSHNRLEMTRASFEALLANTNWDLVRSLYIVDDESTDGTLQYLQEALERVPVDSLLTSRRMGGSVGGINFMLDGSDAEIVGKVDNDLIVCPGWLDAMYDTLLAHRHVEALGMEPGFGAPLAPLDVPRTAVKARWIGGIFLARRKAFRVRPRQNDRFFGLTAVWRSRSTAWISPQLPCPLLDHLPFEPWLSLTEDYIEKGWQRRWPDSLYPESWSDVWSWWTAADPSRKMETAAR